jgi:hypothetical protein
MTPATHVAANDHGAGSATVDQAIGLAELARQLAEAHHGLEAMIIASIPARLRADRVPLWRDNMPPAAVSLWQEANEAHRQARALAYQGTAAGRRYRELQARLASLEATDEAPGP